MVEGRRVEARLDASRRGLGEIMAFPIVRWVAYRTPTIVWPQLSFNLRLPTVELRSCRYETLQGYGTHGVVSRMKDPISCTSYHKARCLYKYCSKSFIPYPSTRSCYDQHHRPTKANIYDCTTLSRRQSPNNSRDVRGPDLLIRTARKARDLIVLYSRRH